MKAAIYDLDGKKAGNIDLPVQFAEDYNSDLIKRAVHAITLNSRQPYGNFEFAGTRPSISLSRRRHVYKTTYGFGISRVPRKIVSGKGSRFNWIGAFAPGMVSGRRAHPAKAYKEWTVKINTKERKKAIRSALKATTLKDLLKLRVENDLPIVLDSKFENLSKTKEVIKVLDKLGFAKILDRSSSKSIRAGRGKSRGRKHKSKLGPLMVVSGKCSLEKAAKNIPGIEITQVRLLNASLLSHGEHARLVIYTEGAINKIKDENLFN